MRFLILAFGLVGVLLATTSALRFMSSAVLADNRMGLPIWPNGLFTKDLPIKLRAKRSVDDEVLGSNDEESFEDEADESDEDDLDDVDDDDEEFESVEDDDEAEPEPIEDEDESCGEPNEIRGPRFLPHPRHMYIRRAL